MKGTIRKCFLAMGLCGLLLATADGTGAQDKALPDKGVQNKSVIIVERFSAASMPAQSQEQKQAMSELAGNAKSCLVVKHKGTVGRRLLWTALIGVPIAPGAKYDHVDAINFQNAKPAYKGKDLQGFQAQGVRVMILEKNYTQENLDSARRSCREPDGPATQPKQEPKPPEQKQEAKSPA